MRANCDSAQFWEAFDFHYGGHPRLPDDGFCDFSLSIKPPSVLQSILRRQITVEIDGDQPFLPLPYSQAYPLFEWGLNWCVSMHVHRWILVHAAVVERGGKALILPAPPGSGKSTLCAALVSRGWRLLSDELAMLDPVTLDLHPFPRPVSLKNRSIDIIRAFASPDAVGPVFVDTHKGDVGHLKVPDASRAAADRTAQPGWIVFPRYRAGADLTLQAIPHAEGALGLIDNSFNHERLGASAFRALAGATALCGTYRFEYSRLDDAIACFDRLAAGAYGEG